MGTGDEHQRIHTMKREYVVKSVDSAGDGSPYVIVSLSSAKDLEESRTPQSPFATKVMGFTNMGDMMKDLNKVFSGGMTSLTSIRLDIHEYKKMNIAVGDRVFLEMSKAETLGV